MESTTNITLQYAATHIGLLPLRENRLEILKELDHKYADYLLPHRVYHSQGDIRYHFSSGKHMASVHTCLFGGCQLACFPNFPDRTCSFLYFPCHVKSSL